MKPTHFLLLAILTTYVSAQTPSASAPAASKEVDGVYSDAHALYLDLHQNPELSFHEAETATKLAKHLRGLGYEVTEHVGGTGVVAILKNEAGPVIMLRFPWKRRRGCLTQAKSTQKTTRDTMFP
jgi:hippurate hydrolase